MRVPLVPEIPVLDNGKRTRLLAAVSLSKAKHHRPLKIQHQAVVKKERKEGWEKGKKKQKEKKLTCLHFDRE